MTTTNKTLADVAAIRECPLFRYGTDEVEGRLVGGKPALRFRKDPAKAIERAGLPQTMPVTFDDGSQGEVVVAEFGVGFTVKGKHYVYAYSTPKAAAPQRDPEVEAERAAQDRQSYLDAKMRALRADRDALAK